MYIHYSVNVTNNKYFYIDVQLVNFLSLKHRWDVDFGIAESPLKNADIDFLFFDLELSSSSSSALNIRQNTSIILTER